ncbi:hypothetical protein BU26DRAFT_517895 [Trematosphaeria pertusa]|uniref:DUF202 domain-containing protein n=1 Tax=Trematosphaeria pertusa TaxID=390896 RepID=A0A6A6IMY3_9PLEO|nr:uncharacterized protein BU26DRAFT_517895 [Trematosphaeria pertusa]KAF2251182.1 hypothetical protein BU26DRAFT_517895 [Trematosphaeria pertusa]
MDSSQAAAPDAGGRVSVSAHEHQSSASHDSTNTSSPTTRDSLDRKSVSFSEPREPFMASGSRKRSFRRQQELSERDAATSSADESAPIMRHAQGNSKNDYQSISPSIAAKESANATGTDDSATAQEGTTGTVQTGSTQERTAEAEREAAQVVRREGGRWRKWLEKYGSVELENKGSVARDHLALERTFLAWLRTSLSFASIGIAVTQLFRLNTTIAPSNPSDPSATPQARLRHVGKPLGATFIGISVVILFIGFHRYFEAQHYVIRGKFPASRGSILVVSAVAGALILSSLVVILAIAPRAFES